MSDRVAICIPTYQSEGFIARTLSCAQNQTHQNLEIIISVDLSDDRTKDMCREAACKDPRIQVLIQDSRQGWSQNANCAIKAVTSPYFFIYFHDDIISDRYVEVLLRKLLEHPNAASTHCDLEEFDLVEDIKPAHNYIGDPLNRVIDFLMTQRGTTLRSLVRKSAFKKLLLFPIIEGDRHWTAFAFHLHLLAAGDSMAVNQALYRRWQRHGSLTRSAGWQANNTKSIVSGQKESINYCLELFSQYIEDPESLRVAKYALKLFQYLFLRRQQLLIKDYSDIRGQIDTFIKLSEEQLHFGLISNSNLSNMIINEKQLRQIECEFSKYHLN